MICKIKRIVKEKEGKRYYTNYLQFIENDMLIYQVAVKPVFELTADQFKLYNACILSMSKQEFKE